MTIEDEEYVSPLHWITADDDNAGVSLGTLVEATHQSVLEEALGTEAAQLERGVAQVKADTLRTLARTGRHARAEFQRRASLAHEWIHHHQAEYESLAELLHDAANEEMSPGELSDITWMAEQGLPFLAAYEMDVPARMFTHQGTLAYKGRAAVPNLRGIVENEGMTEAEKVEAARELMELVANPTSTDKEIRGTNTVATLEVWEFIQDGHSLLILKVDSQQLSLLHTKLDGLRPTWSHSAHSPQKWLEDYSRSGKGDYDGTE